MASLLIMTLMAVSLVVSTGYTAYTIVKASDRVSQVQRAQAQLHRTATLIEANLRSVGGDGVADPPAPADGGRLPDWIAPGARTPWGAEIGYCVFAPAPDRVSTTIVARAWPGDGIPGARAFVVSAPAAPASLATAGIVAAVVAPAVGTSKLPACADLSVVDGRLEVANGTAVGIARGASADMAALAAAATVRRFVAPAALGDGTGTTPADAMSLTQALGAWGATHPVTTVLTLAAGRHVVPAAALDALAGDDEAAGRSARLILKAATGADVVLASDTAETTLRLPVDAKLENLSSEIGVEAMAGTRLTLAGRIGVASSRGPAIKATQARLDVTGALVAEARAGDAIVVQGGEALFREARVDTVFAGGRSGVVGSLGASIVFASGGRRPSLRARARGAAMAAIRSGGQRLILDHADVTVENGGQFGVILEGGSLEMVSASVGSASARPVSTTVLDIGGTAATADPGTQLWAGAVGRCAQGVLFQEPPSAARKADQGAESPGALFAPAGASPANRASWTCRD